MKRSYMLLLLLSAGTFIGRYLFKRRDTKQNVNKQADTLQYAGIPDQVESTDDVQLQNAKMVSEGSQFGVQYYNETVNPTLNGQAEQSNKS